MTIVVTVDYTHPETIHPVVATLDHRLGGAAVRGNHPAILNVVDAFVLLSDVGGGGDGGEIRVHRRSHYHGHGGGDACDVDAHLFAGLRC